MILGLGPSLKNVDILSISDDTIAVNNFIKIGEELDFEPTHYIAVDSAFARAPFIDTVYRTIAKYKNTNILLGRHIVGKLQRDNKVSLDKVYTIYGGRGLFHSNKKIDFTKQIPVAGNVVSTAIMSAIYLGYEEIVLLGADFNSFASQKSLHAYEEEDSSRKISMWQELFAYSFVAYVHKELRIYADDNDIKIINATPGSLIDAYERGHY